VVRSHTVDRRPPVRPRTDGGPRPVKATRKGRATEEAFREGARRVFARDGYLNARISDIADAAGKSVASFYNYYDSKADLLAVLAEEFHLETTRLAQAPYREGRPPAEALREAVAGFWDTYARHRGELIGVFEAAMVDPEFAQRWTELRGRAIRNIAREIRHAQQAGFCPGIDPELTASSLSAMLEQFCYVWQVRSGDRITTQFSRERAVETLASVWFHAIYWRPEGA
jgi:AcrR family transcriptional regulator